MPSVIFIDPLPPKVAQARAVQPVPTLPQERLSITPHCCRASHRGLQEPPELGWGEREINVGDPQGCERIDDRIGHGRRGPDRPGLTDPLRAQRVERRGGFLEFALHRRDSGGPQDRVVRECRGEELAPPRHSPPFPPGLPPPPAPSRPAPAPPPAAG